MSMQLLSCVASGKHSKAQLAGLRSGRRIQGLLMSTMQPGIKHSRLVSHPQPSHTPVLLNTRHAAAGQNSLKKHIT